jgi:hypothetical protein
MKNTLYSSAAIGLFLLLLFFGFMNNHTKDNVIKTSPQEGSSAINLKYSSAIHKESVVIGSSSFDVLFYEVGDPGFYLSFLIIANQTIIFDSKKMGIEIAGEDFYDGSWIKTLVQNGRETMMFIEHGFASNPARTLILEKINGAFQITLLDTNIGDAYFYDTDKDGNMELMGSISLGQVPLTPGEIAVYNWYVDRYVPNKNLTFQEALKRVKSAEEEFRKQPDDIAFDHLISMYLLTGQIDQGRARLPEYLEWAKKAADANALIVKYRNIFDSKEFISEYSSYKDWIQQLPAGKVELLSVKEE